MLCPQSYKTGCPRTWFCVCALQNSARRGRVCHDLHMSFSVGDPWEIVALREVGSSYTWNSQRFFFDYGFGENLRPSREH